MNNTDNQNGMVTIAGSVDNIIYQNPDNAYTVCEIETEDGTPLVLVGTMPYIAPGDTLNALGKIVFHPQYGKQMKVERYEKILPSSNTDITRYLASGVIRGIGPKTATRICERFGAETFDVLESHPEWLAEIQGISLKKAREIGEQYKKMSGARNVVMFCREYLSDAMSLKVYTKWGGAAVDIIKRNPYRLCGEFAGIGFARADTIAASLGISDNDEARIRAGITYILSSEAAKNGHCCLPEDMLRRLCSELLSVEDEYIRRAQEVMLAHDELKSHSVGGVVYIFLSKYYLAEKYVADKLSLIDRQCPKIDTFDAELLIERLENETGIEYAVMQKKAISSALSSGVMILTGGPGTGKTTVIKALLAIFDTLKLKYAQAAPTGRAAKRMSDATSCEAKTVHRLLEMEYHGDGSLDFKRNHDCPLDESVVIIDEASMMDLLLTEALLKAMKPGSRLIFIGDVDQLPSVGAGCVLSDIISSGQFNTIRLFEIFRQASESLIITNAHAINEGKMPDIFSKKGDFFYLARSNERDIAATVADLYKNRLPKSYGREIIDKIQVITPSKKGAAGTVSLNKLLQESLNPASPDKDEYRRGETVFRVGDRVMQVRNNYDLIWTKDDNEGTGIFNGDIGVIESIDISDRTMIINFDDRITPYDMSSLEELEHAYAITVHKSQGSEYPVVIMPLYHCPYMLLTRNLFYTAVTRAAEMVVLVGFRDVIGTMVTNNRHTVRYTGLTWQLESKNDA